MNNPVLSVASGDHVIILNTYAYVHYYNKEILCIETTQPFELGQLIVDAQAYQVNQRLNSPFLHEYTAHTGILAIVNGVVGIINDNDLYDDMHDMTNQYITLEQSNVFFHISTVDNIKEYPFQIETGILEDEGKIEILRKLIQGYTFDERLQEIGKIKFFNQLPSFNAKLREDKLNAIFAPYN